MTEEIAILGGGVAGLSAAHELIERGFEVSVYERKSIFGGKARSMPVPDSETPGHDPLPGEHGFRFFPSFYRHLFDTLHRIPFGNNENGVFDNLTPTTRMLIAREDASDISLPSEFPNSIEEWDTVLKVWFAGEVDIPAHEMNFFLDKMLTFLCSCQERRDEQYDNISWWDYIEADGKSEAYQAFLARGLTRSLVAMRAEESSTRTIAAIYLQMIFGLASPWLDVDSVLDGPTNDVWIDPWVDYLKQRGVRFHPDTVIDKLECDGDRIIEVNATHNGQGLDIHAERYIAALPVEVMITLLTDEILEADPSLDGMSQLDTAWMNGIQFYLDYDVPLSHGHGLFVDSPWALTSISQHQFWEDVDLSDYGNGDVDGILSICISDWETPGEIYNKPAKECTPEEVKDEVWHQMEQALNDDDVAELDEANIIDWHLDPSITYPNPNQATNLEPLLINTVGSLGNRPPAVTALRNFYLASDYVRTNTDLATMESANEAARRAVNGILDATNYSGDRCEVFELKEPEVFEPVKRLDKLRYKLGLSAPGLT
jgi:uncharacterized protein with NAD-binding domain and iron-sulfur cluster